MKKATEKQLAIIRFISAKKEAQTKQQILDEFGHWYYYNASKHIGDVLSRMVTSGFLHRPKRGVYDIGGSKKETIDSDQLSLF